MGKVKDFYQDEIEQAAEQEPFPRGPGDPDAFGYPGQPDEPITTEGAPSAEQLPF